MWNTLLKNSVPSKGFKNDYAARGIQKFHKQSVLRSYPVESIKNILLEIIADIKKKKKIAIQYEYHRVGNSED